MPEESETQKEPGRDPFPASSSSFFASSSFPVRRTITLPEESETQKEPGRDPFPATSSSFFASSSTHWESRVIWKEAPICSRRRGDE